MFRNIITIFNTKMQSKSIARRRYIKPPRPPYRKTQTTYSDEYNIRTIISNASSLLKSVSLGYIAVPLSLIASSIYAYKTGNKPSILSQEQTEIITRPFTGGVFNINNVPTLVGILIGIQLHYIINREPSIHEPGDANSTTPRPPTSNNMEEGGDEETKVDNTSDTELVTFSDETEYTRTPDKNLIVYYANAPETKKVIPWFLTTIEKETIRDWESLEKVVIPKCVTTIGESAFKGCSKLKTIIIPESVTTIGKSAFEGCSSLESIRLPSTIKTMPDRLFANCSKLKEIFVTAYLYNISSSAMENCPTDLQIIHYSDY
jgi:hypothetical protein